MAPLKWIAGLTLASAASLASCAPTNAPPPDALDIGCQFVADLIANATQAEQQAAQQGSLCSQDSSLVADVGYAKYRGSHDASTGLNSWKGIRYAAPPTGNLRWQPPHALPLDPAAPITDAASFGPVCHQTMPSVAFPVPPDFTGDEDCLFLNVYAPPSAQKLPVLVYIHEGGYGLGDGRHNMADIINANEKGFVAVTLQYRLGAFGWLSSSEVKTKGAVNAGMLDQALALAWVKRNICQFGGDASRVTISGESAGGASVMYHGIAVEGTLGNLLHNQGIAASPYLPFQERFDRAKPTNNYYAFSQAAGCPSSGDVFNCLVAKDAAALQQANHETTQASPYGYWAFWPVTDNCYIKNRPSQQLATKKLNGQNLLVGHNANEGGLFVPPLTTEADLVDWLQTGQFQNLTPAQIATILAANPNSAVTGTTGPLFETNGLSGLTAVQVAQDADGQKQRGNNIYAEAVFACPAYWLAEGYTRASSSAWLYQYSVPFAFHGSDVGAYFGPNMPNHSADLVLAFRRIWGNFVRTGNPSITASVANGGASANPHAPHPATSWPAWNDAAPQLMNLNTTGGVPYDSQLLWGPVVTQFADPGLVNAISLAPVAQWEGGRKGRCDVYRGLAESIPL